MEDALIPRWLVILLCAICLSTCVSRPIRAQNTGALMPNVQPTFFNASGSAVASLGFVCTTVSGGTTALLTYQDSALTTANQDPIRLNAAGRAVNGSTEVSIYLQPGNAYRVSIYAAGSSGTCNGVPVGTLLRQIDPVYDLAQLIFNPKDYRLFKTAAGYFVERTSDGTILGSDPADAGAALNTFFTAVGSTLFYNNSQSGPFPGGVTLHCSPTIAPASAAAYFLNTTVAIPPTQNFILDCPNTTWQSTLNNADVFTIDSAIDSTFNLGIVTMTTANTSGAAVRVKPVTVGPDGLTTFNISFVNVLAVVQSGDGIVLDTTGSGAINNSNFYLAECNLTGGNSTKRCYQLHGGASNAISNNQISLRFENAATTAVRLDTLGGLVQDNWIDLNASNTANYPTNFPIDNQLTSANPNRFTVHDAKQGTSAASDTYQFSGFSGLARQIVGVLSTDITTTSSSVNMIVNPALAVVSASSNASAVYVSALGGDGNAQISVSHTGSAGTPPLEFFSDSTPIANFKTNGGNGSIIVNALTTDFSSGIFVSRGTMAVITTSVSAQVLAFNASGGDGKTQIVTTKTGGATTQPLEIFSDSTLLATFAPGALAFNNITTSNTGDFLCINNATQAVTQGTTCTLSSERYKHDFEPLDAGLDTVLRIPTYSYVRNDHPEMGRQVGLKAEAVAEIEPRVVLLDKDGKPSTVLYENYTAILTKAIQELNQRLEKLEAK